MISISENFTFIMKLSFIHSDLYNYLLIQVMKIQLYGKCAHIFKVPTEHWQITPLNFLTAQRDLDNRERNDFKQSQFTWEKEERNIFSSSS